MSKLFTAEEVKAIKGVAKRCEVKPVDVARIAGVCKVADPQEGSKWTYGVVWSTQLGDIAREQGWTTYRDSNDNDNDMDHVMSALCTCLVLRQTSAKKGLGIGYVFNDLKTVRTGTVLASREIAGELAEQFGGKVDKRKGKRKAQPPCDDCLETPCVCDEEEEED